MQAVWKFPFTITGRLTIDLPAGATVLSVQMQRGLPVLWALTDLDIDVHQTRSFAIFGTGQKIPEDIKHLHFISTFQDDPYVWHAFEVLS